MNVEHRAMRVFSCVRVSSEAVCLRSMGTLAARKNLLGARAVINGAAWRELEGGVGGTISTSIFYTSFTASLRDTVWSVGARREDPFYSVIWSDECSAERASGVKQLCDYSGWMGTPIDSMPRKQVY